MKAYIKNVSVIAVFLAFSSMLCNAQTLHTVVFCNTIDQSIGKSMAIEFLNVKNQFKTLAGLIDYDEDNHYLDGPICTRDNLKMIIDQMDVEDGDVIMTFYGGHGSHAPNNEDDPWPQYLMNSGFENQGNWVPMASLAKWVRAKNPRLAIILSNCCNSVQEATTKKPLWAMGGDYTSLDGIVADRYKKLFSAKGLVMATSSKLGEVSWCGIPDGGLYTCDFFEALKMVGTGKVNPDWESLLKKAYDLCAARDIRAHDGVYKQHPYYEVNSNPGHVDRRDDKRKFNDPLDQLLSNLLSRERSDRLDMIQGLLSKNYFGKFNLILTVGTDLETVIENETPNNFLRRISLSPYIKQVNIIKEESGILTVHEVRTK